MPRDGKLQWPARTGEKSDMPQHPKVSIGLVKDWSRNRPMVAVEDVEGLLTVLIPVDAALVRHGRSDLARQLRKAVAMVVEG